MRILPVLIAFAAGAAATGAASIDRQPENFGVSGYDLTKQADRELAAFDQAHPGCSMWTNWQKLCSRMGPGGSSTCKTDPTIRVRQSAPFCAIGKPSVFSIEGERERVSRNRFCVKFESSRKGGQSDMTEQRCIEYRSGRPFSGETLPQLLHPACEVWGAWKARGPDICTVGQPAKGLPSCTSPSLRNFKTREQLACTKWRAGLSCRKPVGVTTKEMPLSSAARRMSAHQLLEGNTKATLPPPPLVDVDIAQSPNRVFPVLGSYCVDHNR